MVAQGLTILGALVLGHTPYPLVRPSISIAPRKRRFIALRFTEETPGLVMTVELERVQ